MDVAESMTSTAIEARLRELLQRALDVKQSTAIDPPLQVSKLAPDNQDLFGPIAGDKDTHMSAVEMAAKSIFYSTLVCCTDAPRPIHG